MGIQRWGKDGVDYRLIKSDEGHFVMFTDHEQVFAELNGRLEDTAYAAVVLQRAVDELRAELAAKSKEVDRLEDGMQEILRVHANDNHRPKAFYIATKHLGLKEINAAMGEGNGR